MVLSVKMRLSGGRYSGALHPVSAYGEITPRYKPTAVEAQQVETGVRLCI